jgi:site-specific DNA-methyltransferase (adenine-specific)
MNRLFLHSCESMPELADNTVALTVTSPPYWNAIDYDVHTSTRGANYRPRQDEDYAAYLDFLRRCFKEVLRVHRDGSFCAVVIGTVLLDGVHTPLPFHFTSLMEEIGWRFHQDIVWYKCTGGVKRAGSTIQNPYPGYYYPNIMTEYILIFRRGQRTSRRKLASASIRSSARKSGERRLRSRISARRTARQKQDSRIPLDSIFTREIANNIWHIAPVPPGQYDHPCPFPEEIPYRLIQLYSYKDDLVLDPFAGIGTTLKVAESLARLWVGYEIKQHYVDIALKRIHEPLRLRKQLICKFDKLAHGTILPSPGRQRPRPRSKRAPTKGT